MSYTLLGQPCLLVKPVENIEDYRVVVRYPEENMLRGRVADRGEILKPEGSTHRR